MKHTLNIVIPVYNEADVLEKSILKQYAFYSQNLSSFDWHITIANNGSIDTTSDIAKRLSKQFERVKWQDIPVKGRGNALKQVWSGSNADFQCYMDVDLATDLKDFPKLIDNLVQGYDISVGSKYMPGANYKRHFSRYILSKSFNLLNKMLFNAQFTDSQCGFKAITKNAASKLLPKIQDNNWFFDTELLVYAQKNNFKIKEVPVTWHELGMAKKSGVKVIRTIFDYLMKLIGLRIRLLNNK